MASISSTLRFQRSKNSSSETFSAFIFLRSSATDRLRRLPCGPFLGARAIEDLRFDFRLHQLGAFLAPVAERVLNDLIGDFFVALADDDVDRRLAADELRQRRDHDRVAELGAHLHGFFQRLIDLVFQADLAQLEAQIGNHAAGHLVLILRVVVFHRRADGKAFALGDVGEMVGHRFEQFFVDQRFVAEGAEILGDIEERRIRRAVGQRRQRGVDDLDAELDRFETAKRAEAGGAVGVQLDRNAVGIGET